MAEDHAVLHVPQYRRAPSTPRHCLFNNCDNNTRFRIPESIKVHILCEFKLFIPDAARVCREHLEGNGWAELPDHCNVSHDFSAGQFSEALDMLCRQGPRLDFSVRGAMSNEEMHFWTGLNSEKFGFIIEQTRSLSTRCNQPRTALGVYLSKLRTGDSNERLATLFGMSRRKLERLLAIARECLTNDYVPLHLGLDHITRQDVLRRNLSIPKQLFGNEENSKVILVCDGTYIFIQKSSNFLFQRQSYSLHKFNNLLKPFLMVCTDGYILDVIGPYAATKSDANILSEIILDEDNAIHWFLEQNDVFILDRGFRDCIADLESHGFESHTPPTKDRQETQLTTIQANKSRLVTLCRWVVEVVNGRFKRDYKLLRQDYFNKALPNMFRDFKIAAAILNHFHSTIVDSVHAQDFLNIIREKMELPNDLHTYVQERQINRRQAVFERLDANQLVDFPRLNEVDVILLALGTYQLKLAKSYCGEHLQNGLYTIDVCRENAINDLPNVQGNNVWLLRGRIQSRHVRARTYYTYIVIDLNQVGRNAITQHYCTCLTGRRTIGSCAHLISIVWYLGYARYNAFHAPAIFLNDVIIDQSN